MVGERLKLAETSQNILRSKRTRRSGEYPEINLPGITLSFTDPTGNELGTYLLFIYLHSEDKFP